MATGAHALIMLVDAPTTARFTRWFSQRIGADVRIERVSTPGTGGGWSNETLILDLSRLGRVVVRLQPAGPSMFRTYELAREYTILETLSALGQPKVPKPLAIDQHGTIAGRPLFVIAARTDVEKFSRAWRKKFPRTRLSCLGRFVRPGALPADALNLAAYRGFEHLKS